MNRSVILTVAYLLAHHGHGYAKKSPHQTKASTITEQHEKMRLAYLGSHPNPSLVPLFEEPVIDLTWDDLPVSETVTEKDVTRAWHTFHNKEADLLKLNAQRDEYLAKRHSVYRKYREMKQELAHFEKKYHKELSAAHTNTYLTEKIRKAQYEASSAYWNYSAEAQLFKVRHPEKLIVLTDDELKIV